MRTTAELREGFLSYFESKGHVRLPSGSLVPATFDPSVLLTTADGRHGYLIGEGASREGDRPFLDRFELTTGKTERLFRSEAPYYEEPVSLLDLFPTFAAAAGESVHVSDGREASADLAAVAEGRVSRTHVLSQFAQREFGLYLAVERDWKYIYSAADAKEWLFHTSADPHETHISTTVAMPR